MHRHLTLDEGKRGKVRIVKLLAVLESRSTGGRSRQPWEIARLLGVIREAGKSLEPNTYSDCSRVGMAQNSLTEVA